MAAAALLQLGSTLLVNTGFSWIVGTSCARYWLRSGADPVAEGPWIDLFRRADLAAAGLCLVALCGAVWAAAAVMTGDALEAAGPMIGMTIAQTGFGQAATVGAMIFLTIGGLRASAGKSPRSDAAIAVLLLVFAASRASVSHAGENGMASRGFAVEWVHLLLVALWSGGVAVGGWLVLPRACAAGRDPMPIERYLRRLSHAATIALGGIVATGLYNAFQRVGSVRHLVGNPYGTALLVKLAFVGLAAALGGYNKLFGFPSLLKSAGASRRVIAILRVESVLLALAFAAAAFLTTQAPPLAM